jgi:hypothetical protein
VQTIGLVELLGLIALSSEQLLAMHAHALAVPLAAADGSAGPMTLAQTGQAMQNAAGADGTRGDEAAPMLDADEPRAPSDGTPVVSERVLCISSILCHRLDPIAQAHAHAQQARLSRGAGRTAVGGAVAGGKSLRSTALLLNHALAQIRERGGAAMSSLSGLANPAADNSGAPADIARRWTALS